MVQKNGKATGSDSIYVETFKIIVEQDAAGLTLWTVLFNAIYCSGRIRHDWLKFTFVTISKKINAP